MSIDKMQELCARLLKIIPNYNTWVVFLALYDAVKSRLNGPEELAKVEKCLAAHIFLLLSYIFQSTWLAGSYGTVFFKNY